MLQAFSSLSHHTPNLNSKFSSLLNMTHLAGFLAKSAFHYPLFSHLEAKQIIDHLLTLPLIYPPYLHLNNDFLSISSNLGSRQNFDLIFSNVCASHLET